MTLSDIKLINIFFTMTIMQQSFAQTDQFGQMIYTAPSGWKVAKFHDGVAMLPTQLPANEKLFIQIFQAINFSGTIEQALEKSYDEACYILQANKMHEVRGKSYNTGEAKKSFRGWDYIRCSGGIQVNNGTPYPDEFGLDLFVIKINDRYERIAIVKSRNTCNGLSRYYPTERMNYHNAIEEFLFSLKFDDWQEPVIKMATVKGEGIIGAWQGIGMSVGLSKPGAELGAELAVKQLIFFSNGQAYFGKYFPAEGLDELNTWIKAENNRRDWGTYIFNNGKCVLQMPYGDIPLLLNNNKLTITTNKTNHVYIKQNPVDGAKLNGTYTLSEWNGMIPSVSFTTDGKFVDNGAVRVLFHEYVDCLNPAVNPGSGTYEVKNYSMLLNYTDGRKIKIAFPGTGFDKNNISPPTLLLSYNFDTMNRI
jgi:hypothetical protein